MERAGHLPLRRSHRSGRLRDWAASESLRARAWIARFRLDRELASGADLHHPLRRERARVLVDLDRRGRLGKNLERVLAAAECSPRGLSAEAPLDRDAIAKARAPLLALAGDLHDPGAVSPQGVARAVLLLADGTSGLYRAGEPGELSVELGAARAALHLGPRLESGDGGG